MVEIIESKVLYKKNLTEELVLMGFKAEMSFKAGQFFQLIIDKDNINNREKGFRAYSIITSPAEAQSTGMIETFIKLIPGGLASGYIARLKEGDEVLIRGPYGKFVLNENSKNHIFLSSGTGITPMYSMIKEYLKEGHDMTLFYSAKTLKDLIFNEEFLKLKEKYPQFHYYPALTREESETWKGLKGRIQLHFDKIDFNKEHLENKTFYICGLKDFISDLRQKLVDEGVETTNIIFERYN